jgi:hypothetical protein
MHRACDPEVWQPPTILLKKGSCVLVLPEGTHRYCVCVCCSRRRWGCKDTPRSYAATKDSVANKSRSLCRDWFLLVSNTAAATAPSATCAARSAAVTQYTCCLLM